MKFLEHLILRAAHLERRARWFGQLSESILYWSPGFDESEARILLFSEGRIQLADTVQWRQGLPRYFPISAGHESDDSGR